MLKNCSSVLVVGCPTLAGKIRKHFPSLSVREEEVWTKGKPTKAEKIIISYLQAPYCISEYHKARTCVAVMGVDNMQSLMEQGFDDFILLPLVKETGIMALSLALTRRVAVVRGDMLTDSYKDLLDTAENRVWSFGKYRFDFDKRRYFIDEKETILTKCEEAYLALWLLHGERKSQKRYILHRMRKRLGEDFLAEIDRKGKIKEADDAGRREEGTGREGLHVAEGEESADSVLVPGAVHKQKGKRKETDEA